MIQDFISIFSGIVLMKDSKILLLRKKNTGIRTVPFIKENNGISLTDKSLQNIEDILNIKINPDSLIKSIIVNKVTEEKETSLGHFTICIQRQWELNLNTQNTQYDNIYRFELNELDSIKITADMLDILKAINNWKKYLEL